MAIVEFVWLLKESEADAMDLEWWGVFSVYRYPKWGLYNAMARRSKIIM